MFRAHPFRHLGVVSLLAIAAALAGCESGEKKAERFAESGLAYMAEGDLESASLQFNNALFQDGNNVVALRGAAEIAKQRKLTQRQVRMLLRLVEVVPNDLEANNELAKVFLLSGQTAEARTRAEKVLELEPDNATALSTIGALLVLENRLDEADAVLARALAKDPGNADVYSLMVAQSLRTDDVETAMIKLQEGLAKSKNPETLLVVQLVMAERYRGEAEVISAFRQLIDAVPDNGLYRQRFAEYVMVKQRDLPQARRLLAEALPHLEDKSPVVARLVSIDRQLKGDAAGEATLRAYLADAPDDVNLRFAVPTYYCEIGKYDLCKAEYEKLAGDDALDQDRKARALNGLSDVLIAQSDMAGAAEVIERALVADPTNAPALINKAQLALIDQRNEEAIEFLRSALNSEPDNAEGLVFLALAYEQSGQIQFADAQFARALDQAGYQRSIVDQYRGFLQRQGEVERAREVLERYLRNTPNDAAARISLAQIAISEGQFAEAEAMAREIVAADVKHVAGRAVLVRALASQQRFADALPFAEALYAESPGSEDAFLLRAGILRGLGRGAEVSRDLQTRIASPNASPDDYAILSDIQRMESKFEASRDTAVAGLLRHPKNERLYLAAYLGEKALKRDDVAIDFLARGAREATDTVQIRTLLANDLITEGRSDDAIAVLRTLKDENKLAPLTANNLASLLLDKGNANAEALEIAQRLQGSDNPYFIDTVAWAYYRNGDLENAQLYMRRAAEALRDNADVQYHHGVIEKARGNNEIAKAALERARAAVGPNTQTKIADIDAALAGL